MIYLDSAATTPVADEVFEAMLPWIKDNYGNAGSIYKIGKEARAAIEDARCKVARMFNANPENIIFTSGGSEGNSFSFQAAAERMRQTGKTHILVSSVEHDSVLRAADSLTKQGFHVDYIPVFRGGSVSFEAVEQAVTPETGLISIMFVNNETGAINLLNNIGKMCQRKGILFHTDCVQAAGFIPIDVEKIGCDFATASAHKFHGPKGVGCVYVRNQDAISPMIFGGHNQEYGLRGGTENTAGIVGMGIAADLAVDSMSKIQEISWGHRISFWERVSEKLGNTVHLNGQWIAPSKILNIRIDGIDADTMVTAMGDCGIYISAGSACRSKELQPSHVLTAMGLSPDEARNSVRISFSSMTTKEEVEEAADVFVGMVELLRSAAYDI